MLRSILQDVPQNPIHHPEGSVWKHVRLVRASMDRAIEDMQKAIIRYPAFFKFSIEFSKKERNLLRAAAYLHDIGKVSATSYNGDKGYQAIGHEESSHIFIGLSKLQNSLWNKMDVSPGDLKELLFLIKNHMRKYGKATQNKFIDSEGCFLPEIKLLIVLHMMDQLGRDAFYDLSYFIKAAESRKARAARVHEHENQPDNPEDFVDYLFEKGLSVEVIRTALEGKRAKGVFSLSDDEINSLVQ